MELFATFQDAHNIFMVMEFFGAKSLVSDVWLLVVFCVFTLQHFGQCFYGCSWSPYGQPYHKWWDVISLKFDNIAPEKIGIERLHSGNPT